MTLPLLDLEEEFCPLREDEIHCDCWWDCGACCACGVPPHDNPDNCDGCKALREEAQT